MHDLRTAVYRHLQRLSLAFFTKTRTGEVQSRHRERHRRRRQRSHLDRDVGDVDRDHGDRDGDRDVPLDWQLSAVRARPVAALRADDPKVGEQRRAIATVRQESMADMSALVQESLSVSGILLGKTMGRSTELAQRFDYESDRLSGLEVRSRMAGRWMMASIQMTFAVMPAPSTGSPGRRGRSRSGHSSPSPPCRRGSSPRSAACSASRSTCRARWRSSTASSSTSTSLSTSRRARAPSTRCAATSASRTSGSATDGGVGALGRRLRDPGRHDDRDRRRDGRREDDAGLPRLPPLRRLEGGSRSTVSTCAS